MEGTRRAFIGKSIGAAGAVAATSLTGVKPATATPPKPATRRDGYRRAFGRIAPDLEADAAAVVGAPEPMTLPETATVEEIATTTNVEKILNFSPMDTKQVRDVLFVAFKRRIPLGQACLLINDGPPRGKRVEVSSALRPGYRRLRLAVEDTLENRRFSYSGGSYYI